MSKTKIEWASHSWNPITGCTKISPGCRNCYAERMARRLAGRYGYPKAPHHFDVRWRPERLDEPLKRKKPTTYFVCSMSDPFHKDVSLDYIHKIFSVMAAADRHIFQVLTKRPGRMLNFCQSKWYRDLLHNHGLNNVWLGVTAENQATADERIPLLLQIPAAVRFVSIEPCLSAVNMVKYLPSLIEGAHDDREREGLSSIYGVRLVQRRQEGSDMETLPVQGRRYSESEEIRGAHQSRARCLSERWLPPRNVHYRNRTAKTGGRSPHCMDGTQQLPDTQGVRTESQGWYQAEQPPCESGAGDTQREYPPCDLHLGQDSPCPSRDAGSEIDGRASVPDSQSVERKSNVTTRNGQEVRSKRGINPRRDLPQNLEASPRAYLDWVIVGGESGPGARPMMTDWAQDLVRQCRDAGIPVFVKQMGTWAARFAKYKNRKGADPAEWPADLRVREFPFERHFNE